MMHPSKPIPTKNKIVERIPKTSRYDNVKTKIDSGMTIDKVKVVNVKEIVKRRDEIFYRLTRNQMFELLNEYEGGDEKPYLVLDVREEFAFTLLRIQNARSYPSVMVRRDFILPEVYDFRNKEDMLVILYCDDERVSSEVANVLVNRGIDNIFLLSGGLRSFTEKYPNFVDGTERNEIFSIPEKEEKVTRERVGEREKTSLRLTESNLRRLKQGKTNSSSSNSVRSLNNSIRGSESELSTVSVARSVISRSVERHRL